MKKAVAWTKIKKEYLEGVTPKDLALKYKLKAKTISDKACSENWTAEKKKITENIREMTEEKISSLTSKALATLEQVLEDPEAKHADKVAAARAVIDVSGLKKDKHEVKNTTPLIVVETEKHKQMLEDL